MKLVLFAAAGRIGSRILNEALARGHEVTAAVRDPARVEVQSPALRCVAADVTQAEEIARVAAGHDAAISAVGGKPGGDQGVIAVAARALVAGLDAAGPRRLVIVGGAGTLEIRPGVQRLDTPEYPEIYRPAGIAQKAALATYQASDLDWTYLSPPIIIEPGSRSGRYRTGGNAVLFDAAGKSRISMEDFAVALLDEIERPQHVRARFTVAD
jgi:putative NADH-flavin reductase